VTYTTAKREIRNGDWVLSEGCCWINPIKIWLCWCNQNAFWSERLFRQLHVDILQGQ